MYIFSLSVYGILDLMRILFVADGRSPTTLNWLRYWIENGYDVHIISTFPCAVIPRLASLSIPIAFSRFAGNQGNKLDSAWPSGQIGRFPRFITKIKIFSWSIPVYFITKVGFSEINR